MKRTLLIISILLIASTASGQQLENRPYFTVSYFGILATHPGVKIGFQYPLHTFDQENLAGDLNQIVGSTNMIFYFHRKNHIGAGLNVELGFSHKKPDGINKEIFLGVGYLRTFIPHSIYDFDGQNGGEKRRFLGVNHLLKTAAIGFGKNMDIDIFADSWMIKPTLLHIKPYNTGSTLNFALDVGYQFRK